MMDMTFVKHKRNNPTCDPWNERNEKNAMKKRNEKNAISIFIAFSIDISIRNENIISEEHKTKDRLK